MTDDPAYTVGEQRLWDATASRVAVKRYVEIRSDIWWDRSTAEEREDRCAAIATEAGLVADALIIERRKRVQK